MDKRNLFPDKYIGYHTFGLGVNNTLINEDPFAKTANGHEYVDLGLPSGTLWAKYNVGAQSEDNQGLKFRWGETEGFSSYTAPNSYKYLDETTDLYTKYNDEDNKTTLDLEDDAARVNMGGLWHMPTMKQIQELFENTTYEFISNSENLEYTGLLLTSKINNNILYFTLPLGEENLPITTIEIIPNELSLNILCLLVYNMIFDLLTIKPNNVPREINTGFQIRGVLDNDSLNGELNQISLEREFVDLSGITMGIENRYTFLIKPNSEIQVTVKRVGPPVIGELLQTITLEGYLLITAMETCEVLLIITYGLSKQVIPISVLGGTRMISSFRDLNIPLKPANGWSVALTEGTDVANVTLHYERASLRAKVEEGSGTYIFTNSDTGCSFSITCEVE